MNTSLQEAYLNLQNASGVTVGDTVKVTHAVSDFTLGWDNSWNPCMTKHVGSTGKVVQVDKYGVTIAFNGEFNGWQFPVFCLKVVKKVPVVEWLGLSNGVTAAVEEGADVVALNKRVTRLTREDIRNLADAIAKS